jgi:hypothetical protein
MDWPHTEKPVESSRKQRKGKTKKQLEEIHSEKSWKKLE